MARKKESNEIPKPQNPMIPIDPLLMSMFPGCLLPPYPVPIGFPPKLMKGGKPAQKQKSAKIRKKGVSPMSHVRDSESSGIGDQDSEGEGDDEDEDRQAHDGKKRNADRKAYNIASRGRERIHNDYNQHFVDTGERPQNFIRDAEEDKRFEEYPKLERLLKLKREIITKRATPARHIRADLRNFDWDSLKVLFDVVLVNPPWRCRKMESNIKCGWDGQDLCEYLPIDKIVDSRAFCFIWCDVYTLDEAMDALKHWGFRRCEDICWIKTNINWTNIDSRANKRHKMKNFHAIENPALLHRTSEHCLMGLKGLIRRNEDDYFIHSNLDTDVIIAEEADPREMLKREIDLKTNPENIQMQMDAYLIETNPKPAEIFDIIDRFCLGRRKLEIFGSDSTVRKGWVTISPAVSSTNYDAEEYKNWTEGDSCWPEVQDYNGGRLMGTSEEIESLRPKSPSKSAKQDQPSNSLKELVS